MQTALKAIADEPRPWQLTLLEYILVSRESDLRENTLYRQGRGQFHVSSSGHESVAIFARHMRPQDWIFSHYRDKALMLARGVPLIDVALGYFAKADSSSGGRQMVNHFFHQELNVASSATPTGLHCLPAAGVAWGIKKSSDNALVFCFIGDASTRQGEFWEAVAFSIQESLPIIFVVEDNGYGISTPTDKMSPLALGLLPRARVIEAHDPLDLDKSVADIIAAARQGDGPQLLWLKLDRLTSHTASDDHSKYRAPDDIDAMTKRDPVKRLGDGLLEAGMVSEAELLQMRESVQKYVKEIYGAAERAPEPIRQDKATNLSKASSRVLSLEHHAADQWTMSGAVNYALSRILSENKNAVVFGEDVEDPKGGVFGLTKGLSTLFPLQVKNSPLAEATIAGLASGLASVGYLPVFELQFIDFMGPAFNQIVNQIATLYWRTNGRQNCPLILYAPCGGYVGGGQWHSQTNEGLLAHIPGLKVYTPGDANSAAQMFYNAAQGTDPVLILLPKNQFQKQCVVERQIRLHPERARILKAGEQVSIVAWGNCVEMSMEAASSLASMGIGAEVIDVCALAPCDWNTIVASVEKTGRLVVVQEDSKTCSFGQAIISELCGRESVWGSLYSPPQLVTRGDEYISFNRGVERETLPDTSKIVSAVLAAMGRL